MSPAERRAALVERMRDIISCIYESQGITEVAEAALDLALEEAAKVAEEREQLETLGIAEAIRTLKGKEST